MARSRSTSRRHRPPRDRAAEAALGRWTGRGGWRRATGWPWWPPAAPWCPSGWTAGSPPCGPGAWTSWWAGTRSSARRHLAGTDEQRAADLQQAWCDPATRAVVCARGGSGAARIVDLLDWDAMRAAGPRVLVGFSDVTVLHQAVANRLGLVTLAGPMAATEVFAGAAPDDAVGAAPAVHPVRPRVGPGARGRWPAARGRRPRPRCPRGRHPRPARQHRRHARAPAGPRRPGRARGRRRAGVPDRLDADPAAAHRVVRRGRGDRARLVARLRAGRARDAGGAAGAAGGAAGLRPAVRSRGAAADRPARRRGRPGRRRRQPHPGAAGPCADQPSALVSRRGRRAARPAPSRPWPGPGPG